MTPRSNLSDFIKERCIKAARAALGGGGDVEEAIAERLDRRRAALSYRPEAHQERRAAGKGEVRQGPPEVRARVARARSCAA